MPPARPGHDFGANLARHLPKGRRTEAAAFQGTASNGVQAHGHRIRQPRAPCAPQQPMPTPASVVICARWRLRGTVCDAQLHRRNCDGTDMRTGLLLVIFALFMGGCAQPTPGPAINREAVAAIGSSLSDSFQAMARRFPPNSIGSEADRLVIAEQLIEDHAERRRNMGFPYGSVAQMMEDKRGLVDWPASNARFEAENQSRQIMQRYGVAVASLDGRQVTPGDVTRIAAARLEAERPGLQGAARRSALEEMEREVRQVVEARRRNTANTAVATREIELTRLASTNLADMPREILRSAEENLFDSRSPFDLRSNWRPEPSAIRREEVRLRAAIAQRMEANMAAAQAAAAASAQAARRDAVLQQCRMQAAMAGAAVPSPYRGAGLGGAIASGIAGALRSAEMESGVLRACLNASGF